MQDGTLIDANTTEFADPRTIDQLNALWDRMLATEETAQQAVDATVAAYEASRSDVRLTDTDKKILAVIDKHGHVESQADFLDKFAEGGKVMDSGTAKPRFAELKANGTLVAWNGNRGYKRPD